MGIRGVEVPVLVYHRIGEAPPGSKHPNTWVSAEAFSRQLFILKAMGFRAVTPETYLQLREGVPCEAPGKPVLITFDDGSVTVYSRALPILKRHGFTAAVFMVSSGMGGPASWDGETGACGHRQMNVDELRALKREGWTIGSHSATHQRLSALDGGRLEAELAQSRAALAAATGEEPSWLAYPYGDFTPGVRDAASRAGYRVAFATENGDGDSLSIPRRIISGSAGPVRFVRHLYQARRLARL